MQYTDKGGIPTIKLIPPQVAPVQEPNSLYHKPKSLTGKYAVDPYAIAKALGIAIDTFDFSELMNENIGRCGGGIYANDGESVAIYINSNRPETVQRHTVGHELRHHLYGFFGEKQFKGSIEKPNPEVERACQKFGAELLIPVDRLLLAIAEIGLRPYDLARAFNVSITLMRIRLRELGLIGRKPRPKVQ